MYKALTKTRIAYVHPFFLLSTTSHLFIPASDCNHHAYGRTSTKNITILGLQTARDELPQPRSQCILRHAVNETDIEITPGTVLALIVLTVMSSAGTKSYMMTNG